MSPKCKTIVGSGHTRVDLKVSTALRFDLSSMPVEVYHLCIKMAYSSNDRSAESPNDCGSLCNSLRYKTQVIKCCDTLGGCLHVTS